MDLHRELLPARRSFWNNKPTWTIEQFVFLLHGYDPVEFGEQRGIGSPDEMMLKKELSDWLQWSPGCPGILPNDRNPMECPIDKSELINWASELAEVIIPSWMIDHAGTDKKNLAEKLVVQEIGDRAKENLLATIGALALLVVEKTNDQTGDIEKPNYSGIAKLIIKTHGKVPGMADASLRTRFSTGISKFLETGINTFKEKES